jgi:hypothetical protein
LRLSFARESEREVAERGMRKKRSGGRLWSALGLLAGAAGTALLLRRRKRKILKESQTTYDYLTGAIADRWARPGMEVTFRAELMPGRSRAERTFRVERLLPSGRVTLDGVAGEHTESAFEPLRTS